MKTLSLILILVAILITTKQVVNISESSPVEYLQICREDTYDKALFKKLGIYVFSDGTVIKDFIISVPVPSCP
jgi:hypothetical protein